MTEGRFKGPVWNQIENIEICLESGLEPLHADFFTLKSDLYADQRIVSFHVQHTLFPKLCISIK